MTSWANLEAYLARLVKSIGGADYVLRDSAGKHLAPRPPEIDPAALADATAALARDIMESGADPGRLREIERRVIAQALLASRQRRAEHRGEPSRDEPPEDILRDFERVMRLKVRFKQHSAALESATGASFVTKGPGKRYVDRSAELPFIAERFLSSYLLIVSFDSVDALDQGGALLTLERARSTICDMLEDLPPDDDGDRAVSNVNRPA